MTTPPTPTDRLHPALRRALMRVRPEWFGWSAAERERWHMAMPDDEELAIERAVLSELFGVRAATREALREAREDLDDAQTNLVNAVILPIRGMGDDAFWLNEHLGERSPADFDTLGDYDRWDHAFQEAAWRERDPAHALQPYRGRLDGCWARLFLGGRFTYATLDCAASHVFVELQEAGDAVVRRLVPHELVPGEAHGRQEAGGIRWDMRPDAGGREEHLEELRKRMWTHLAARHREAQEEWAREALGRVWMIDRSRPDDPQLDVVFSDPTAMDAVRLRSFVADCRRIETTSPLLEERVAAETARLEAHLHEQLADIEASVDPAVRRLRRRRRVHLAPGALEDLGGLEE